VLANDPEGGFRATIVLPGAAFTPLVLA